MSQTKNAPYSKLGCAVLRPSPCAARGLACMPRGSNVPITVEPVLHAAQREQGRAILQQRPRPFGQPARVWTLKRRAAVCHEPGLSDPTRSGPLLRDASVRLGVSWPCAQHWMVSPDPADESQKTPCPAEPDGRHPFGPGVGLRRRRVVQPCSPASQAGLEPRHACPPGGTDGPSPGPRGSSRGLCWALCAHSPPDGGALRAGTSRPAGSPAPFSRGGPRPVWPRVNGPSCASGSMPPGTSARRYKHGAPPPIATPTRRGAVASWSVGD